MSPWPTHSATPGGLSLQARALQLLARREHSRLELRRKLGPHASSPEALEQVLEQLQARGYLNEQRVADSLVHRRAHQLGTQRVRAELEALGLDDELVRDTVAGLRDTELERAKEVWQRKFGQAPRDPKERARQMRFLAARGFGGSLPWQVVPEVVSEDPAAD